jgi:hypothetical protein
VLLCCEVLRESPGAPPWRAGGYILVNHSHINHILRLHEHIADAPGGASPKHLHRPTATASRLPPQLPAVRRRAMPMPKKTCPACGAKCSIGLKVCACGMKFKSKRATNWAGVKIPPKASPQRIERGHRPPPAPCAVERRLALTWWCEVATRTARRLRTCSHAPTVPLAPRPQAPKSEGNGRRSSCVAQVG